MRPEILFPLFAPASVLPGIGPRLTKPLTKLAGPSVVDLLWHLPSGLIDRRYAPKVVEAEPGRIATLELSVIRHQPPKGPPGTGRPYKVRCRDETGEIYLVFFHPRPEYLHKVLPEGAVRIVSGRVEDYGDERQITHPDHIAPPSERARLQTIEPVYPLAAGITLKPLARAIEAALMRAPELPEWLDGALLRREGWPGWRAALEQAHHPQSEAELRPQALPRARLAYDELLANQLALALIRTRNRRRPARARRGDGRFRRAVERALPFALTAGQRQVLAEIAGEMAQPARMFRLLQGDVGSGKTVVALLAALIVIETGGQAAVMAPTELLARQHFATLERLAAPAGIRLALLVGRGRPDRTLLADLAEGHIDLVIGTHALFQEGVAFKDLALAIIDEQHRFGVHQRLSLASKGADAHVLVMTATPIPRTLMLTAYGDLDVSRLAEKPPGRAPVDTRTIPTARMTEVLSAIRRALKARTKVYWICPLVEESEKADLAAATARHAQLTALFGPRVGLVHGRLKGAEKDAAMAGFAGEAYDLLVATTVVEVGVDVPQASIMVIEHAERFGLAQLHQLRGRIGRSDKPGTCLLLYTPPLGAAAKKRLSTLRETDDGFRIAEEDLRLRGAGELLGVRQSGLPQFRLADLGTHAVLVQAARDDAALIVARDPELKSARGEALRTLLYLFERDAAVKYFLSG